MGLKIESMYGPRREETENMNKRVLFVCQGNVGRSQMAEGFYNFMVEGKQAISAGIDDVAEKYGGHPTQEIISVMAEEGIDVSTQQIKQVRPEMVEGVEHVVVLCQPDICPPFITESPKTQFIGIEDPFQMSLDKTREIRERVKESVSFVREKIAQEV